LGETPFVQVSTTWASTCPEMVYQRPCMTREIETWLLDIRVTTEADDQSSLPCIIVSTDVMSDNIGRRVVMIGLTSAVWLSN